MFAILAVNGTGFYVYYFLSLQNIRREMRERLKLTADEELEILTLVAEDYKQAIADDHEVKVNGKMYDVARIKTLGDSVVVYCTHDEKEDDLLAFAAAIFSMPLKDK